MSWKENYLSMPYRKLYKLAEKWFHKFIVARDRGVCFTGTWWHNGTEAGHLFHNKLDFNEFNLHAQCTHCNHYLSGNLGEYTIRFISKYGQAVYDKLKAESERISKYTPEQLVEIIEQSKAKLKLLEVKA